MSVNFSSKLNEKYNLADEGVGFYLWVRRILRYSLWRYGFHFGDLDRVHCLVYINTKIIFRFSYQANNCFYQRNCLSFF